MEAYQIGFDAALAREPPERCQEIWLAGRKKDSGFYTCFCMGWIAGFKLLSRSGIEHGTDGKEERVNER